MAKVLVVGILDRLAFARSAELELMDDLDIQGAELADTLAEIELLNRTLFGYGPSIEGVAELVGDRRQFTMLDVGVGGGDMARRVVDWADARGIEAQVLGIDLADTTVQYARNRCAGYPGIRIEKQDLFRLPDDQRFDVVHAAQVLHHFPADEAVRALTKMLALARAGVVVNDLHRHRVPWVAVGLLTAALSRNRLIRNDAPLSVRRAFVAKDLEDYARRAGATDIEVRWRPLFRWRMVLRTP